MKKGIAIFPGWLFPFVYCVAGVDAYLTQLQAAEKLNISVQHYRSVEAGRRGASIELLVEIANTFHTSLDYIIFGRSTEKRLGELKTELQGVITALKAIEKTL